MEGGDNIDNMKCYVISLGCCKNLVDSEQIAGLLHKAGVTFVNRPSRADLIWINTCGFIESAKKEAIDTIFDMVSVKEKTHCKLIVSGCLAQRYLNELKAQIPEVDAFIPLQDYETMNDTLKAILGLDIQEHYGKTTRLRSNNPWMAYLKLGDGCDNRCAYCAIPLIRGPYHSYPLEDLVEEAQHLVDDGVRELVLIAQDTTRYGTDYPGKPRMLKDLLYRLQQIESLHWIRILYMYPDEIDQPLLDAIKACSKVIPYYDIPMQHGNDRMLKLMNRRGSAKECVDLVQTIRKQFDHPILRTTLIVGFPTETDDDFDEMMQFIDTCQWDHLGAFTYSREEDTASYDMQPQVEASVMQERLDRLMARQYEIYSNHIEKQLGNTMEVLIERKDGLTGKYYGRGKFQAPDGVDGDFIVTSDQTIPLGSFVNVKLTGFEGYDLIGEVIE